MPKRNKIILSWNGVDDARRFLQALPRELHAQGGGIVMEAVQNAYFDIKNRYPIDDGDLYRGLYVQVKRGGQYGIVAKLRQRAPHASLVEFGTKGKERHWKNRGLKRHGTRSTGVMPPAPPGDYFIPLIQLHRARMNIKLKRLLERQGLRVTWSPSRVFSRVISRAA